MFVAAMLLLQAANFPQDTARRIDFRGSFVQRDGVGILTRRAAELCQRLSSFGPTEDSGRQTADAITPPVVTNPFVCLSDRLRSRSAPRRQIAAKWASDSGEYGLLEAALVLQWERPRDQVLVELIATLALIDAQRFVPPRSDGPPGPWDGPPGDRGNGVLRRAADLVDSATSAPTASAHLFRACASLQVDLENLAVAHECSVRALSAGRDSTWHLLMLAWIASQSSDGESVIRWFQLAAHSAHDAGSRSDLGWHLMPGLDEVPGHRTTYGTTSDAVNSGYAMARSERAEWLELPDSRLLDWVRRRAKVASGRHLWISVDTGVVQHFRGITYWGSAFRSCIPHDPGPRCGADIRAQETPLLGVVASQYLLWNRTTGEPEAITAYSVTGTAAAATPLILTVRQSGGESLEWRDTTFIRQPSRPGPRSRGDTVVGAVVTRATSGRSSWSLLVGTKRHEPRGGAFDDQSEPLRGSSIALSDIIIAPVSGAQVELPNGEQVAVTSTGEINRGQPASLFFQARNDESAQVLNAVIAVYQISGRKGRGRSSLRLQMPLSLQPGVQGVSRELALSKLNKGSYRIEVQLVNRAGRPIDRRSAMIRLR